MNRRLLVVLLSNYMSVISLGFFAPIFALYVVELGGTVADAGIAAAIYYIAGGFLMLFLRLIINAKKSRAKYYIIGNALEAIAAFLYIFTNSVPQFYIVQLVHALATALRVPSQRALYAQHADKGKEGSEWSIMEGGNFIIIGVSAAAGGLVVTLLSYHAVFVIMGIFQTMTTLYCLKLLKYNKRSK